MRTHIIFWVLTAALLTVIFGRVFESYILAFYFVAMLLPVAFGTSFFFNYYLVPKYLFKKRYLRLALYGFYLLVVSTYLEMWVVVGSYVLLADMNYSALSPVVADIAILAIILYFIVFLNAFLLLIRRSFLIQERTRSLRAEKKKHEKGYLSVRADRKQAKLLYEEILYMESLGDYVKIVTDTGSPVITRERISHLGDQLPGNFLRIHRSFIVNTWKIDFYSKTELEIDGRSLPISRSYKKKVAAKLA